MGFIRNLKEINEFIEEEEAKHSGDKASTRWFGIKDRQSVKVVFLQELDEEATGNSEKNGLGALVVEHVHPENYRRKFVCSMEDEGDCIGCQRHRADFRAGWRGRIKMYVNVLVDNGTDEPYVAVISQGLSGKSITPTLLEYAGDDNTITDKWFSIGRKGSGLSDTSYTIRAGKKHELNVEDYEVFSIEEVVKVIPFAEQEEFLKPDDDKVAAVESFATQDLSVSNVDDEWV